MRAARWIAVVPAVVLVASCSSAETKCEPVSSTYREAFEDPESMVGRASVEGDILAVASRVDGAWYIAAKVDGSTPVWVTDRDPQGDDLGKIVTANRAAQRHSSLDFVFPPISMSEVVQAAGDPEGIAAAEACIGG